MLTQHFWPPLAALGVSEASPALAPAHPPDLRQRLVAHLRRYPGLARRPYAALGHLHAQAWLLAQHEQWLGVLTRRLLRRGDFASRDDLEAKIIALTIRHNKHARPCKWSTTPTTPATSNAIASPDPCLPSQKPPDRNAR
jgi:hypothetical protein